MIIYKTTNQLNGMIYVGKDKHNNSQYIGSGLKLINAVNKYGRSSFKKDTLEVCSTEQELALREVYWITKLEALNPAIGYNIAEGGCGGNTRKGYSDNEMIDYRSNLSEGVCNSEAYKKFVIKRTGKVRPEHSKKMKELYALGLIVPHNKGKHCPDYVKDAISKANRGKKLTQEHKSKIGKSKWVEIEKYDLDDKLLNTYKSIAEACALNSLTRDQISGCLIGRYKKGGSFVWKYKITTNNK